MATDTRYTTCAPSSETNSEPSGATVTPTGRPFTFPFVGVHTLPSGVGIPLTISSDPRNHFQYVLGASTDPAERRTAITTWLAELRKRADVTMLYLAK